MPKAPWMTAPLLLMARQSRQRHETGTGNAYWNVTLEYR